MSKLFTILTALVIATASAVAGYVYYTGGESGGTTCQNGSGSTGQTATTPSNDDGCPFCSQSKSQSSCCSGESSVKAAAMNAKATPACCSEGETTGQELLAVVGGAAAVTPSEPANQASGSEAVLGIAAAK